MEFRLLGPVEAVDDDRVAAVGAGKRLALLALLLVHRNELLPAERLIDELWGEAPPATAAKSLQVHVSQLRKALRAAGDAANGDRLVTRGHGYALRVEPDEVDSERFERSLREAQRSLAAGDARRACARLDEALALWRGDPLSDVAYEPFAQREIARLEELRVVALEVRLDAALALGRHGDAVGELEALVRAHPLRERFRAQLMLALYRCGRQADALAAYRDAGELLRDELGIEPGPELRELEGRILRQDPGLAAPRPPAAEAAPSGPPAGSPPAMAAPAQPEPPEVGAAAPAARPLSRRGPLLVLTGGALLAVVAAAALLRSGGSSDQAPVRSGPILDAARNSVVALDREGRGAELAVPLPGRPTDLAAAGGTVWVTTVDAAGVSAVDARTRSIARTVLLRGAPDAVAAGEGSLWVADSGRGELVEIEPGYDRIVRRIRYPRAPRRDAPRPGRRPRPRSALTVTGGSVWITNGSADLLRLDTRSGALRTIRAGAALHGIAAGSGAVWVLSSTRSSVLRVDPVTGRITDRIPIARPGAESPFPIGIAAGPRWIWVLNANTATVTRIDPRIRGVATTIPIGVDRVPTDIAASGDVAWVSNADGSASRIDGDATQAESVWIGESLELVAADPTRVWLTTSAIEANLGGGEG